MRHDSGDVERVIEQFNRVADLHVLAVCVDVVHENVVWSLQGAAFEIVERPKGIERFQVDSPDRLQSASC